MLGGADNPNGELPSYITGADSGLERDIPQAEGIASDGRNSLWIVSEPDRFYRFSRTTTS
ncbi:SdiA-regulated domain-containing protein [Salmonella enterica]